ncbi:helix-turn-helix transcriptional regulator [Nocardioides taihuensis]|uniref:LuxR C-terminal-related transcriptional regulator n=1 Tax=Nocardioides taihuensis TaxID=1835606 RepID=A0ABW0BL07_9ACTN
MPDVTLTESQQAALRLLAAARPVPGTPLLPADVLEAVARLVPCDSLVVGRANDTGLIEEMTGLGHTPFEDPQVCDGPLVLGIRHVGVTPSEHARLRARGLQDSLWLGCRNGPDHVVQLDLMRRNRYFTGQDVALLRLVTPWLLHLMRERPTPALPASLTVQERRVLVRVAAGHSNAQVAEFLGVEVSTVRKHLEHAYRKLGVGSRTAAVARMQGRDEVDLDLAGRLERFA